MKPACSIIIIAIIFSLSTNREIYGQYSSDGYSVNPKIGVYNYKSGEDPSSVAGVEITTLKKYTIYAIDYYHYEESVLFKNPSEKYNQLDLLIGKYSGDRFLRFQYEGGIGVFWGLERGEKEASIFDYKSVNFFTIGIPLKLGFKFLPTRFIGVGFDLQANMNFKKPTAMGMLSFEVGHLRNKINRTR